MKKKSATRTSVGNASPDSVIKFGTDGWRGQIALDYTFDNVRRCAQGFASYLLRTNSSRAVKRGIVIGGDKRFGSEHFAAAAAEVLAGNGIPVGLVRRPRGECLRLRQKLG